MFLTEKNLLEKFIDNCEPAIKYYNFNTVSILTAFCWSDFDNSDLWEKAFNELYIQKSSYNKNERNIRQSMSWIDEDAIYDEEDFDAHDKEDEIEDDDEDWI